MLCYDWKHVVCVSFSESHRNSLIKDSLLFILQIFEWWYFRKYGTSFIEQVSVSHLRPLLGGVDSSSPSNSNTSNGEADSNRQSVSGKSWYVGHSCINVLGSYWTPAIITSAVWVNSAKSKERMMRIALILLLFSFIYILADAVMPNYQCTHQCTGNYLCQKPDSMISNLTFRHVSYSNDIHSRQAEYRRGFMLLFWQLLMFWRVLCWNPRAVFYFSVAKPWVWK